MIRSHEMLFEMNERNKQKIQHTTNVHLRDERRLRFWIVLLLLLLGYCFHFHPLA